MTPRALEVTRRRKRHGFFWFLFIGWWYLLIKWTCEAIVLIYYYVLIEWVRAIALKVMKKKYTSPQWVKSMVLPRKRTYTAREVMLTCNNCGHKQSGEYDEDLIEFDGYTLDPYAAVVERQRQTEYRK